MKKYLFLFCCLIISGPWLTGQSMSAAKLLKKSMDYHDPEGKMMSVTMMLKLNEPRPGGEERISNLTFSPAENSFKMLRQTGDTEVMMMLKDDQSSFTLNGSSEFSEEDKKKYRLNPERLSMMKNYYHYLWFMPMKLQDPGTQIDPEIKHADFFGKQSWQMRVTYDPDVGKDIWYFYFDKKTFALIGYRFYHDEAKNDGEYILIEGEVEGHNIRIPKTRKWYTHAEDKYLGMDELLEIITL